MRLVTYLLSGMARLGAWTGDFIVDLDRAHREMLSATPGFSAARSALEPLPAEMLAFLRMGKEGMAAARETLAFVQRQVHDGARETLLRQGVLAPASSARLMAPVPRPPKLIAVWVNYPEHAQEVAVDAPKKAPLFFYQIPHGGYRTGRCHCAASDQQESGL